MQYGSAEADFPESMGLLPKLSLSGLSFLQRRYLLLHARGKGRQCGDLLLNMLLCGPQTDSQL